MNNVLGTKSNTGYTGKLTSDQKEQGTPISGYSTVGPFHCEDCKHRIGGYDSDLPFCIHPAVLADVKLKNLRTKYNNIKCVEINMEKGCCRFVRQEDGGSKD